MAALVANLLSKDPAERVSAKHVVHWCLTRKLKAIDLTSSASADPRDFLACAVSKVEASALLKTAIDSHQWFGDFDYG